MAKYAKYEKFYKHLGLYRFKDLVMARVLDSSLLEYPRYTILHYLGNDANLYPNKDINIFKGVEHGVVTNIFTIPDIDKDNSFRVIRKNEKDLNNKLRKASKDFPTLTNNKLNYYLETKKRYLYDNLPIYNYNKLFENYRYVEKYDTVSKIFKYTYKTIFKNILDLNITLHDKERHHLLIQPLPRIMPSKSILRKYINRELNIETLKEFYSRDRLFILELFKVFKYTYFKESIFTDLRNLKDLESVDIAFTVNDKVTILNLAKLFSFVKEYENIKSDKKLSEMQMFNMFYFFLKVVYNSPAFNLTDIENGKNVDFVKNNILETKTNINFNDLDITKMEKKLVDVEKDEEIHDEESIEADKLLENIKDIENEIVDENVSDNSEYIYKDLKDIDIDKMDYEKTINKKLEVMEKDKIVDNKKVKKILEEIDEIMKEESPYKNGKTIKEMMDVKSEDISLDKEDYEIPDIVGVSEKDFLNNKVEALDSKYIDKVYKKDIVSSVMSIQRAGMVVKNYEINEVKDPTGDFEEHVVTYKGFDKGTATLKFRLPKLEDNGTFIMSSNRYRLRKTRNDLPIRKIHSSRVGLNSAYGKLFIDKAPYKKIDRSFSLRKALLNNEKIEGLILGNRSVVGKVLPTEYTSIMKYVKSFKYQGFLLNFDYINRSKLLKDGLLEKIEKKDMTFLGVKKDKHLLIDKDNIVYILNNDKYEKIDTLLNFLGINEESLIKDYSLLKLMKTYMPVVYVLIYYIGFDNLMKMLNVRVERLEGNKRVEKGNNKIVLKTINETIILTYDKDETSMIVEGMKYYEKELRKITLDTFNNKDETLAFFKEIGFRMVELTELKILDDLYLDPVTINILESMKKPVTFVGLLIEASKMLMNDFYNHPNSSKEYLIRGYDKIPQMLYKNLVKSVKTKVGEDNFGRGKLTLDPFSVWRDINGDNTTILVDEINPFAYIRQKEDTTTTGFGGRSKESMSKDTRELYEDEVGLISEANKFTGDVGITAFLSANPSIENVRGIINTDKELSRGNILSTNALMAPFTDYDDPKRAMFSGIMNSHIIPMINAKPFPVLTGYEPVLAYRLDSKFIGYVKDDCVVEKVMKNKIIVKYKDNKKETFTFKDWTSREENGVSWLNEMISNVVEGEKLKKFDIVYYDKTFFTPYLFDNKKVIYNVYETVNVALEELNATNEDSSIISKKLSSVTKIKKIKVLSKVVNDTDNIKDLVKLKEEVKADSPLFTISNGLNLSEEFDDESSELLEAFVKTTPKAGIEGKILKIAVIYNSDLSNATKSIKDIIDKNKDESMKVNKSYSINGVPLEEGKVEIKFYIEYIDDMGISDKGVIGNQIKFTVGDIMENIVTENGRQIDVKFSSKALSARIVLSPFLMGTTANIIEQMNKDIVDIYFN